jgi:hypothetical protein
MLKKLMANIRELVTSFRRKWAVKHLTTLGGVAPSMQMPRRRRENLTITERLK